MDQNRGWRGAAMADAQGTHARVATTGFSRAFGWFGVVVGASMVDGHVGKGLESFAVICHEPPRGAIRSHAEREAGHFA